MLCFVFNCLYECPFCHSVSLFKTYECECPVVVFSLSFINNITVNKDLMYTIELVELVSMLSNIDDIDDDIKIINVQFGIEVYNKSMFVKNN